MAPKKSSTTFNHQDGVTLKEYFESHSEAQRNYIETRLTAIEKAEALSDDAITAKFVKYDEFYASLRDAGYLTSKEYDIHHEDLVDDIKALQKYQATMEGKASQGSVIFVGILSVIGVVLTILDFFLRK